MSVIWFTTLINTVALISLIVVTSPINSVYSEILLRNNKIFTFMIPLPPEEPLTRMILINYTF